MYNRENIRQVSCCVAGRFGFLSLVMFLVLSSGAALFPGSASAHGERMHQPSLRMRTIQWMDLEWDKHGAVEVGDIVTITGKMYFPSSRYWPGQIKAPDPSYLQVSGPASVFVKREAYINEVPTTKSLSLELGKMYEFKLVMQARIPGEWHLHPTLQITGTGPVVGPGESFNVTGDWDDFVWPVDAGRNGEVHIDNLENYQLANVGMWHGIWIAGAVFWLLWWLRRPVLIPRYRAVKAGMESVLLGRYDVIAAIVVLVGTLVVAGGSYAVANAKYDTIPLQTGSTPIEPLPDRIETINAEMIGAEFDVPARSLRMNLRVTNKGEQPVWLGGFATAGIEFVAGKGSVPSEISQAISASLEDYPEEYIRRSAFTVKSGVGKIAPGETKEVMVAATDAIWEVEGLAKVVNSPVSRFGGVVMFFDESGNKDWQYIDFDAKTVFSNEK